MAKMEFDNLNFDELEREMVSILKQRKREKAFNIIDGNDETLDSLWKDWFIDTPDGPKPV
jgi:hypothetical protein